MTGVSAALLSLVLFASGAPADALARARALAQEKRFDEALAAYDRVLAREPSRLDARLGRAETLLWAGRYDDAEAAYRALVSGAPGSLPAALGLARTAWWRGDYRAARSRWDRVLALDPRNEEATRAKAEIRELTRAVLTLSGRAAHDDQPATLVSGGLSAAAALDPLTRLTVEASGLRLRSAATIGSASAGLLRAGVSAKLPRARLEIAASAGAQRFGSGDELLLGLSADRTLVPGLSLGVEAHRAPALDSAFSYRAHVAATSGALRLALDRGGVLGSAEVRGTSWSDGNAGLSAFGWVLAPLVRGGSVKLSSGAALSYRDARESRFRVESVTSARTGAASFAYTYTGVFDPYVTPERQLEGRLLAKLESEGGGPLGAALTGEWGAGRERAAAFGPSSGPSPFPAAFARGSLSRTYHPWRARAAASYTAAGWTLRAEAERSSSAFYRSSSFELALARRF